MNTFEIIWQIAGKIPEGKVATYGQLAFLAGNPRLSRIAGCAMHSASDFVPCHRVVDRNGRLLPVFGPDGAAFQRALLELEGITFRPDGTVDLQQHIWDGNPE